MSPVLKVFLVVCYATYVVLAQGSQTKPTPPPPTQPTPSTPLDVDVMKDNDDQFVRSVGQLQGHRRRRSVRSLDLLASPSSYRELRPSSVYYDAPSYLYNVPGQLQGHRRRRSVRSLDLLASPSSYRGLRPSSVYYDAPSYLYNVPGYARGSYYAGSARHDEEFSFVRFFDSFYPLRGVLAAENTYVRDYYKIGSFHDCMSDFSRLGLTAIRPLTADLLRSDYGLVGGVSVLASRSSHSVSTSEDYSLGYVGVLSDPPYVVLAVKSGCQLDGFPGFHDCLVFSGATHPFRNTIRRFVYVDRKAVAYTSVDRRYRGLRGLRGLSSLV